MSTRATRATHHVTCPNSHVSWERMLGNLWGHFARANLASVNEYCQDLHVCNVGIVHEARHVRHATAATEALGHLTKARVAHQVVHHVRVTHEILGHAREHGVAHDGAQIGHAAGTTTGTASATAAKHASEAAEVGHAAAAGTRAGGCPGQVGLLGGHLLDAALGRLIALLHGLATAGALVLDALAVGLHGALGVAEGEAGEAQAGPGLGVGRVDGDGRLGVGAGGGVVLGGGVGGGAVGEEDGVAGVQVEGLRVEGDGLGVVLLGHGGVALGFQGLGLLLLLVGGLLPGRGGGILGPGGGCCRGAERLVGGVDLEEGLGPEDGRG